MKYRWAKKAMPDGRMCLYTTRGVSADLVAGIEPVPDKIGWWRVIAFYRNGQTPPQYDGPEDQPGMCRIWSRRCEAKRQAEWLLSQMTTAEDGLAALHDFSRLVQDTFRSFQLFNATFAPSPMRDTVASDRTERP